MTLSELINATDIFEYISQFAEFEEKGGEYWALSPLKEENTPSFSVNTELQTFYDFSSGKGGNLLDFIKAYNHCDTRAAAEILSKYASNIGISAHVPKMEAVRVAKRFAPKKRRLKEAAQDVLPSNYMDRFENNKEKLAIWGSEGIKSQSLDRFQVRYDSFSDRLVYPIRDVDGNIINVSGRTVDPQWKEKGLRKYTYFKPLGALNTLYGLAENREAILARREIILFEGAKSVMLAHSWGVYNAAALLTSHVNQHQLKILASLACRVVFALDEDVDIHEDANIKRLSRYVKVEYLLDRDDFLDDKMSPVDAGYAAFNNLYERRETYR